jgi:hypothetical protein
MKLLTINKDNINYEFRYLERSKVVEITKASRFTYLMKVDRRGLFVCSCPGSKYHHRCWHSKMIKLLLTQPSIASTYPFLNDLAEEAGRMMYNQ